MKPVLVFVSSRRQTRLTALDLIAYAAADERPSQFVHMLEHELEQALATVKVLPVRIWLWCCERLVGRLIYFVNAQRLSKRTARLQDANLRHTLQFGIGLHHAGLGEVDRTLVEQLFVGGKIQVLIALAACLALAALWHDAPGPTSASWVHMVVVSR